MAAFYEFFNEQKYADAVKNVSIGVDERRLAAAEAADSVGGIRTVVGG